MAKQIAIRDDLYQALDSIRGNKSFSQIIEELLREKGVRKDPILEALEAQNKILAELLAEIKALNRKLSALRIEAKETVREVRAVTGVTGEKLPSYLQDNPWLEILAEKK
ncbi:MAG: antitoxin VapB family protein [Candidatus Bathyarchaeia archaeon]